jgi:hypothetical protein
MSELRRAIATVFFLIIFGSTSGHAATIPDGFYILGWRGPAAKTIDGKEIHLLEKVKDGAASPQLDPTSNDNEEYELSVSFTCIYNSCPDFKTALCVAGKCVTPGDKFSADLAQTFAKFLGASLEKRTHPGYAIRTRFLPTKSRFSKDEPIGVVAEICNVGDKTFSLRIGGHNGSLRDHQYRFWANDKDGAVPEMLSEYDMGGLAGIETLKPMDCYRSKILDLRAWLLLNKAEDYWVFGTFDLEFNEHAPKSYHTRIMWEDYATGWFKISVM